MNLNPPWIGNALPHNAPSRSVRCGFLRCPDARLRPGVQIRWRVNRCATSFAEYRSAADDRELGKPARRARQAPIFANVTGRPVAAEVNRRVFHQSFSMRRNVRLDGEIGGSRRKTLVPNADRTRRVSRCHTLSDALSRNVIQSSGDGPAGRRQKPVRLESFLNHRVALLH